MGVGRSKTGSRRMTLATLVASTLGLALIGAGRADAQLTEGVAPVAQDEVLYWNSALLNRFRQDFGTGCPTPLARAGAMVHGAVYDAVNSISRTHEPYIDFVEVDPSASKEMAVAAAAYRTMLALFPNSREVLAAEYNARKALVPNGPSKFAGIRVGNLAAMQMLAERAGDGSDVRESYVFNSAPGFYQPTPPTFNPECNPDAGKIKPFTMTSTTQFRPKMGPCGYRSMTRLLRSEAYAMQVAEVQALGSRNSTVRTDEQTRIAFFWANDANGTYKPPGHLFAITQTISRDQRLSLDDNARLFAQVALAMGDAGVVAWDAKYLTAIDLWRPITAIRRAHLDNNPLTIRDPRWLPLNTFTPPFPAWVSGHATFGAAHAGVLAEFFGTDRMTFTIDSEDPFYTALPGAGPRTFTSFSEAAVENAVSRVYLGVHYRMDGTDGNAAGFALGHYVGANFLKRACIADFNRDGISDALDVSAFYSAYGARDSSADVDGSGAVDMSDLNEFMNAYLEGC
jgi:membrane-associated phospholipid phosphatase